MSCTRRPAATTELDYTEQTSWLLFLKYLDGLEAGQSDGGRARRASRTTSSWTEPYRWAIWAAPKTADGKIDHNVALTGDDLRDFVEQKLFPYLRGFTQSAPRGRTRSNTRSARSSERSRTSSRAATTCARSSTSSTSSASARRPRSTSSRTSTKPRSSNMGNAGRNGGEYYTPRPLIRAIIKSCEPKIGERIYDGAVGSAGFLCESFDYLNAKRDLDDEATCRRFRTAPSTARKRSRLAYVIAIMNMILHGIDAPNVLHTNTLAENLADIQEKDRYDVVLANPPFGGKERKEVQQNFPIKTGETAFLFLQHFIKIAQGRRPCRHRHQEHLPVQHRQRLGQPAQAPPGELQPPHRARPARAARSRARA